MYGMAVRVTICVARPLEWQYYSGNIYMNGIAITRVGHSCQRGNIYIYARIFFILAWPLE